MPFKYGMCSCSYVLFDLGFVLKFFLIEIIKNITLGDIVHCVAFNSSTQWGSLKAYLHTH